MQVRSLPSIRLAEGQLPRLIVEPSRPLEEALEMGSSRSRKSALDGFTANFEDDRLYLVQNDDQAGELLAKNPEWLTRLRYRAGHHEQKDLSGWEAVYDHCRNMKEGALVAQVTSSRSGLPMMSRERAIGLIERLVDEGHLQQGEGGWSPVASSGPILLQGRRRSSGRLDLLISGLTAIDLVGGGEPELFSELQLISRWIEEQAAGQPEIVPAPRRVELPDIGGLGELMTWKAYVPGSHGVAEESQAASHPPSDFMTAGSAAFCREREEELMECDSLRCTVQRFKSGAMVSTASPPREHRLRQRMAALDLYRPASPYGQGVAPMGGLR